MSPRARALTGAAQFVVRAVVMNLHAWIRLSMPRELYLIRHGITENHLAVLGQTDPALTEKYKIGNRAQ